MVSWHLIGTFPNRNCLVRRSSGLSLRISSFSEELVNIAEHPYLPFEKYSGCGNDFILVEKNGLGISDEWGIDGSQSAPLLCNRREGIGADGLLLLTYEHMCREKGILWDASLTIFNPDGSSPAMCGNGLRCAAHLLHRRLQREDGHYCVKTAAAIHHLLVEGGDVEVTMPCQGKIIHYPNPLEFIFLESTSANDVPTDVGPSPLYFVDTGVPHAVLLVDERDSFSVEIWGRRLRHDPLFAPEGANVNFCYKIEQTSRENAKTQLSVRTYERGVEGETAACGTGSAAAALVAAYHWGLSSPVHVRTRWGDWLTYTFSLDETAEGVQARDLSMKGTVKALFSGLYPLDLLPRLLGSAPSSKEKIDDHITHFSR